MTVEEALAASVVEPVNDIFEIDPETPCDYSPGIEKLFGVANDGNSERHFRCPKIVGDNIDLSTMHLYINYQNANGREHPYLVEDMQTDGRGTCDDERSTPGAAGGTGRTQGQHPAVPGGGQSGDAGVTAHRWSAVSLGRMLVTVYVTGQVRPTPSCRWPTRDGMGCC